MDLLTVKTWAIFYLLSFATLLWAIFLTTQGEMLGIGLILDILVIGVNCAIVMAEVKRHVSKKERMRQLLKTTSLARRSTDKAK
jgi:hypothetical protein